MDKVELKVNVINQLKLLRQSTFKDILCFLDEDIQNAQRAKATEVRVTVCRDENTVTIENNGNILTNPQALFSIAESSWDDDVKKTENPFGMGFFSNITVSNFIEIHTGNKLIVFDVDKMMKTNNTEIDVSEIDEYYDGFKLKLKNFDFENVYTWNIKERVELLGSYIHELNIYYNDELQEKRDLTTGDGSEYCFPVEEDSVKGWISLGNNYLYSDNVNIFYKGRYVAKLSDMPYVKGDLHISDKALNLTSPDRKDIIKDSKLTEFRKLIKSYVEDYCNHLLLSGEDEINEYTSCLGWYSDKVKIKNKIRFMTFRSDKEEDLNYLKGIAVARNKNSNVNSFRDYELYLKKEKSGQSEELFTEVEISLKMETSPKKASGKIYHESSSSFSEGYVETPEIKESELIEKKGEVIFNNSEPVFYIGFDEVEKYEYKLNVAKHYNLRIVVSRNRVETSILQNMKNTDNVHHISELQEDVSVIGSLSNTELSMKERRAMMILNMISEILGYSYNLFSIGDLMVTKNIKVESISVDETIIDDNIAVLKDSDSQKIYMDRTVVDKNKLREDLNTNLDINDYKFILSNFREITKQISELNFMKREDCEDKLLLILGQAI